MEVDSRHLSVLRREVVDLLQPQSCTIFLDCTLGLGGHAAALMEAAGPDATLIGVDVDEENLQVARVRLARFAPRVRFFQANFSQAMEVLHEAGAPAVDGLLADLGVASTQIDDPGRGLSFMQEGPLDMRLDKRLDRTAADLVNTMDESALADVIYKYGEERYSRRIAKVIVLARRTTRFETTTQLADVVSRAYPPPARAARRGVHPATRTFQALRIAVNDELGSLERLLGLLPRLVRGGGRAAIISFHSLEDRLVKHAFAAMAAQGVGRILTKKPLTPKDDEIEGNPRSRSAKLRGFEFS